MRRPDGTYKEIVVLYQGQHGPHKIAYWNNADAMQGMMAQTRLGDFIQSIYERDPQIFTQSQYPELYPVEYCKRCVGRTSDCSFPPEECPDFLPERHPLWR